MAQSTDHKESKASVRIVYRKYDTLQDGSHPFFVCITKDRQRKYIATGLSLHPQFWNDEKNTFRKSVPTAKRQALEASFQVWKDKYTNAAEALADADQAHDARSVATKVSDERKATRQFKLLSYFEELINQFEKTGNVGNRKVYRDVQNNLTRYIGEGKDISFDQITVKFCIGWENKMRSEGLTEITLSVKFRTLRAVLNKAIASGYAKPDSYPFARNTAEQHKFQVGKFDTRTTKRAISKADIRKIEAFEPIPYTGPYASLRDTSAREKLARDLFLFSYYCGGINFVDMAMLKWANVGEDLDGKPRLTYVRQKTGGRFSVRLMPSALAILERYRSGMNATPTSYIFPVLNSALHRTPSQIHNRCNKIMGQVNADLKTIGTAVGITTPLTTYVARHSFATALKHSGVATGIISEAMGHSDERTTQIYLSEFDTDLVDAAFENL
ncbi:tyrosine-type recombinase/integrase [Spirosoma sp. HMF4905]|uniref:Tyrosine-type recombinase/integrase n=1 Tax=Spirosoma arboris TaxID=2682092 RepID=A0A7K1SQD5_9BACT|nr:site-specific integrase [Spirosoma arboris]MVM36001.1 tyrosine-type recombinase/integrase [Spirosoma arboris]